MAIDQIGATGLTIATLNDRITTLTTGMQTIFGASINVDPDSPDGQLINIVCQMIQDVAELIQSVNSMMDPDQAIGIILDQRVAFNNIQRQNGTFSQIIVNVTVSAAVSLPGLDQVSNPVFTVADNAGTQWNLISSVSLASAGTYGMLFQASQPGAVQSTPGTITVPVTIVLGVTSVSNPGTVSILGINEETDAALKIRRQQSVALGSQGYLNALEASLQNITGVTYARVFENTTGTTNSDGVPGHSIWVITNSNGAVNPSIAGAIYNGRNAGAGMKGTQTFNITQSDGSIFTVQWDVVVEINLFTTVTLSSANGINAPNFAAIDATLPSLIAPQPWGTVNVGQLSTAIQVIDPNSIPTLTGFSAATTQVLTLSAVAASGNFVLSYNGATTVSIAWNATAATIQSDLNALTGLGSVTVTGSIASQTLTINTGLASVNGLIYVTSNTLLTSGAVAVTFAYSEGYANFLQPVAKNYQFSLIPPSPGALGGTIVLLPLVPSAPNIVTTITGGLPGGVILTALAIVHATTAKFSPLGGYGPFTYSVTTSIGSTINSSGLYTAGGSSGTDTVKITDAIGNFGITTVTVT